MKPILTSFVFVFVLSPIYAQDSFETDNASYNRWEILLNTNMQFRHQEGQSSFDGRNGIQLGYHLSRFLILGLESSVNESWNSWQLQSYAKLRKPIAPRLYWYIQADFGYQRQPFRSESRRYINGELIEETIEEGTRESWNADFSGGFEYAFADRWSGIVNYNLVHKEGLGIRYNF